MFINMHANEHTARLPDPTVLADKDKRAAWIIYELKLRGISLAGLARRYGKYRTNAVNALRTPYPIWEHRIAKELGLKPQDIFPERYDEYGIPNRRMGRPKQSTQSTDGAMA